MIVIEYENLSRPGERCVDRLVCFFLIIHWKERKTSRIKMYKKIGLNKTYIWSVELNTQPNTITKYCIFISTFHDLSL